MASSQGITKSGYLQIKQSSKVRGRKLKTWKRKWVSVHQMSDLSTGTFTAKVNVYTDEETAKRSPSDKITFLLENATKVRMAKSKTHPFAFEVLEAEPVLVFSGENDTESYDWMSVFRRILWPQKEEYELDMFEVSVQSNDHSMRLGLSGSYKMSVTPNGIALHNAQGSEVVQWQLSSLKKFYLDTEPNANQKKVLVVDSGPVSDTGEGSFRFLSEDADIILKYIGQCIKVVIAQKQQQRQQQSEQARSRAVSFTRSEYKYQAILENSRSSVSESDNSSLSSTPPTSPLTISTSPPCSPNHPSCPSFPAHNTVLRSQSKDETGSLDPKASSLPYIMGRHSSESAIINKTEASVMTSTTKPRTQSFTNEQPQQSLSLCDSGIVLQDGDGKQQVEKMRRKSSEVRRGSNSFDSAVSTGSYNEELHVRPAIHEEPVTLATNPNSALPTYPTQAPSSSNNQPLQFNAFPVISDPFNPNNQQPQCFCYPTTHTPLSPNNQPPQFPAFPTTQNSWTPNNQHQQFSANPITSAPLAQNDQQPQCFSYPTTQAPLSPNNKHPQFSANPITSAPLAQNDQQPQCFNYPTTQAPLSPNNQHPQFSVSPITSAPLAQNDQQSQFVAYPTTQAGLIQNNQHPQFTSYPLSPPVFSNNQQPQFVAISSSPKQTSPLLSAGIGCCSQNDQAQFARPLQQEKNIPPQLPAAMPSPLTRTKPIPNYSNIPGNASPALPPPRKKTPPTQQNPEVPTLPPPRKNTPPVKCQDTNSEINTATKSDSVRNSPVNNQVQNPSNDIDPPSVPIYQDIDDQKTMDNSDQKVRRHSTGDLPKENEYEELKSIGKKKKHAKNSKNSKSNETPPELPVRPSTLRYRPKRKDEETKKRRSALANIFLSSERSQSHSSKLNDLKETGSSIDTLDSSDTLSRSSSKDIYSSISSDIDSQASERPELHLHPDVFNMTLIVEPDSKDVESNTTETKKKTDDIIDLFPPTVCNWIKSGGHMAASHVDDLMGLDIPENITASVATPVATPSANRANSLANMANPATNMANPTASVTDWAIISGCQAASDASFVPFFNDTKQKEDKWANFDDFEPFIAVADETHEHVAEPVVSSENESMYIDMTKARSSNKTISDGDSLNVSESNNVTAVSDAAASVDATAGTAAESMYVVPDELT